MPARKKNSPVTRKPNQQTMVARKSTRAKSSQDKVNVSNYDRKMFGYALY